MIAKFKKNLVLSVVAATAIVGGASSALAGITTPAYVFNDNLKQSGNYAWLGDATPQYNCLAYALGNYSNWVWPWGSNNPSNSQVDTYLSNQGYKKSAAMNSTDVAAYEIISYGTSDSSITHFARVAAYGYSNAKWGQLELLQHDGWDPYKSNGSYGDARRKY
ncbi:hypothetical protein P4H70_06950, partial [Paenibacillus ehimensis]|uniref:DUF7689 domain-containing protein n=2 Tax=Paenibacillus ehimensis TaxID=79264 RepID=UPI002DB81FA1